MAIALQVDRHRTGTRALTVALLAGVAILLLPFISGLLGAAIFYVVAEPLLRHLAARSTRRIAALITVLVLFVALVVPGVLLLAELLVQVPDTILALQNSDAVRRMLTLRAGSLDIGAQLQAASADMVRWSSRQTLAVLGGMMGATVNLVIALFGTYYLLMSGDRLWDRTKRLLPFCPTTSELLRVRFHRVTEAMLLGVVFTGAAQGTLVGIALHLAGLDHALFWAASRPRARSCRCSAARSCGCRPRSTCSPAGAPGRRPASCCSARSWCRTWTTRFAWWCTGASRTSTRW